jgi:hypothetical protein
MPRMRMSGCPECGAFPGNGSKLLMVVGRRRPCPGCDVTLRAKRETNAMWFMLPLLVLMTVLNRSVLESTASELAVALILLLLWFFCAFLWWPLERAAQRGASGSA